jgi:hypothetical protein
MGFKGCERFHRNGAKNGADLIDNWFKNLLAQQISGNSQFAIEKPHGRVIRVLDVETGKVEHLFCSPKTKHGRIHTTSGDVSAP